MNLKKIVCENKWGEIKRNKHFRDLTTMKVGGRIKNLFLPNSINSLIVAINYFKENKMKYLIIGNGSNIIASDKVYKDIIIHGKYLKQNVLIEKDRIIVSAFYDLRRLNGFLISRNIQSLLFLAGVPGSVGGAVYMNAGANGREIADVIRSVTYLENGLVITKNSDELHFGYRHSQFFMMDAIILEVCFRIEEGNEIYNKYKELLDKRKQTQPLSFPNSGSIFKNLKNIKAYEVIKKINMQGYEINGAKFSELHANFIINRSKARAKDIYKLILLAQKKAKEMENIDLELEVKLLNFSTKKDKS